MTEASEWRGRVGRTWAEQWRRTDRAFGQLTDRLLAATRGLDFAHALDIGCGAGELTLALARNRPDACVTGVDVSPDLLAVARRRGTNRSNVRFMEGDAAQWTPRPHQSPSFLTSRHGVMFFEDSVAAFANLAGHAAPRARLLFSCFRERSDNPFFTEPARQLPQAPEPPAPGAPGPFAFADRAHVERILGAAGWGDPVFDRFDFPMIAGAGENAVDEAVAYFLNIGPVASATASLDGLARDRLTERLRNLAERSCRGDIVSLPASTWLVTATALA
ncbi:class I SAM-dependent methyltransferase [Aurantiacibacter spongiae]|uniref:Class I SAM-dependent methyltransferase n=1 Tax=Aurantiacibacter spongiae TaxID=2488860 RepID=A0A3N5D7V2_9SPHN|nr:class I SAM-dependent methyltransferase [Aurantiacibacter spongiae]RPF70658.1 class I SAM-dependent methyltransferase [Aurantiacibacter spongiae]